MRRGAERGDREVPVAAAAGQIRGGGMPLVLSPGTGSPLRSGLARTEGGTAGAGELDGEVRGVAGLFSPGR